jgi:hypothetical protein
MKKIPKKNDTIVQVIDGGDFDDEDLRSVTAMLQTAGRKLDKACSHEICGTPLFKAANGIWYTGSVEFHVGIANPEYVADTLLREVFCECPNCGQLDKLEDMSDEPGGPGRCTECDHMSVKVTKKRAAEIARGKPRKK